MKNLLYLVGLVAIVAIAIGVMRNDEADVIVETPDVVEEEMSEDMDAENEMMEDDMSDDSMEMEDDMMEDDSAMEANADMEGEGEGETEM